MDETFKKHVDELQPKFEALMRMKPITLSTITKDAERSGIYLLSEGERNLYIGRSKNIRSRLKMHVGGPAGASFAVKLAREQTDKKATYTPLGSFRQLVTAPDFLAAFENAKNRIRIMQIRYVEEPDCNRQALLEIYATISLSTVYNDFETH